MVTVWRDTEEKRTSDRVVPGESELVISEADVYVGDGITPIHDLQPADREALVTAIRALCDGMGWRA
jgi:hypothetical protein